MDVDEILTAFCKLTRLIEDVVPSGIVDREVCLRIPLVLEPALDPLYSRLAASHLPNEVDALLFTAFRLSILCCIILIVKHLVPPLSDSYACLKAPLSLKLVMT